MAEEGTAPASVRILSVEDDALNRALLRATLARASDARLAGASLVQVASLGEARAALSEGTFELALLDRRLPDGDGFALAGELRAFQPGARIVALTADAVPETRSAALRAGCDELVTKPYVPQALLELLSEELDAGRQQTQAPLPAHSRQSAATRSRPT